LYGRQERRTRPRISDREDFGEEISEGEAREMLDRLVALYQLLSKPLPEDEGKP
jgi:hypothetical protein